MLLHLGVANLGVIGLAEIDPSPKLTVITGETGTGKTLLLGGIRQLLGESGSSHLVGPVEDQAKIDGLFDGPDGEIGVTRVIPKDGRSRTRIDGAVVSADVARRSLGGLVEVIGQHDHISLRRPDQLRRALDDALDSAGSRSLKRYRQAWTEYQVSIQRRQELGGDLTTLTRELDLARHQASEIAASDLSPGLDDKLEQKVSRLRNIEEIRETLAETIDLADQVNDLTGEIVARLRKIVVYDTDIENLGKLTDEVAALAQELSSGSRGALDGQETDPQALHDLESRLTLLGDLKRKYGKTIEEVIDFGAHMARRAAELESMLSESGSIEERVRTDRESVIATASDLTAARSKICVRLTGDVTGHLSDLGMASARVEMELSPIEPGPSGADRIDLMFASDDRLELRPIGDVASGGELSRLVLAFRLAVSDRAASTLVFDEVDAGIGGQTALAMGEKLAKLGEITQVLCVTHLPQVAARADRHYLVSRSADGVASIELVDGEARVQAIATMMSGDDSDAGRAAAQELLAARFK